MWYFDAWKKLSPLRDEVIDQNTRMRVIAALAVAAVISLAWIFAYRYSPTVRSWISSPQDGEIIVSSPTVYTRQRLVNDRLKQIAWLEEQILAADGVMTGADNKPEFKMIDQIKGSTSALSISGEIGKGSSRADGATAPETTASRPNTGREGQEGVSVTPTTAALFRAKNSFREDVRAEMMETQLDDRHDILGNTIYRLSFQASVLAGTQEDAVAGIAVRLSHCPSRKKISPTPETTSCSAVSNDRSETTEVLYRNDYSRLYFDWLRDLQKLVTSSIDNITEQLWVDKLDPSLRLLFSRFIVGRLCERMILGEVPESRIDSRCSPEDMPVSITKEDAESILTNAGLASWITERSLQEFVKIQAEERNKDFSGRLEAALTRYPQIKSDLETPESFRSRVSSSLRCSKPDMPNLASIPLSDLVKTDAKQTEADRSFPAGSDLPCPFVDSEIQRLRAAIFLYKLISNRPGDNTGISYEDILGKSPEEKFNWLVDRQKREGRPFDFRSEARCFAADFMKAKLNTFERPASANEQIDSFMRLVITGKEVRDCQLIVSPRLTPPIDDLEYYLNKDTNLFSYTVTPKNLSENISTTAEVRDAYQMLAQHQFGVGEGANVLAKALREKSENLRAVLEHPIVVGFGSGRQPLQFVESPDGQKSSTIRSTELGWIIAAHIRPGGKLVQVDGQYALTAVISVPSWWKTIEIDIDTCWIPRTELENYLRSKKILFCPDRKPTWTVIQLPGAIAELSRKLGFEVVQEPYITKPELQYLTTGESGQLIFTGGRLWRSTTVTLGSQVANSITVLPNMEGIIAHFDCVKPQRSLNRDLDTQSLPLAGAAENVTARVWTSEGATDAVPVSLVGNANCVEPARLQAGKN